MVVVADTSPFIVLINIGHVAVLPGLFGQVIIPPEVTAELRHSNRPEAVRDFIDSAPPWLVERVPTVMEAIPCLHAGEVAAISLALELKAELLLIDELDGRKAAAERNLRFAGTIGVLELAARRGLLELRDAFERVKKTDFWISPELLAERLQLLEPSKDSG